MSLGNHAHTQGVKKHFDVYQLFADGARDNLGIKISLNLYPLYDSSISFFHGPPSKNDHGYIPLTCKACSWSQKIHREPQVCRFLHGNSHTMVRRSETS